jgi:hypothetical protein
MRAAPFVEQRTTLLKQKVGHCAWECAPFMGSPAPIRWPCRRSVAGSLVLQDLAKVTYIDPATAHGALYEVLPFVLRFATMTFANILRARAPQRQQERPQRHDLREPATARPRLNAVTCAVVQSPQSCAPPLIPQGAARGRIACANPYLQVERQAASAGDLLSVERPVEFRLGPCLLIARITVLALVPSQGEAAVAVF